jgi:hypothetical protein
MDSEVDVTALSHHYALGEYSTAKGTCNKQAWWGNSNSEHVRDPGTAEGQNGW